MRKHAALLTIAVLTVFLVFGVGTQKLVQAADDGAAAFFKAIDDCEFPMTDEQMKAKMKELRDLMLARWRDPELKKKFKGTTLTVAGQGGHVMAPVTWLEDEIYELMGIKLKYAQLPITALFERMTQELVVGTGAYDLVMYLPNFIGDWEPYLADLTPYAKDPRYHFDIDDFPPALSLQDNYGDKKCGQTYDGDYHLYLFRKDWFSDPKEQEAFKKKFGRPLGVPKTWDEYLEIANFFYRPDEDVYGDVFWGRRGYCWPWWYDRFVSVPGAVWFDEDMKPGINSAAGVKALENLVACRKAAIPAIMSTDYDAAKAAMFRKANVAQIILWPGAPIKVNTPRESNIPGKAGFDLYPGWEIDGKYYRRFSIPAGHSWAVSKDSKKQDAAAWVVSFITGKEAAIIAGADPDNGIEHYRISSFEHPKAMLLTDPSRNKPEDIFPEQKGKLPTAFTKLEDAEHYCKMGKIAFANAYPQITLPGQAEYYEKLDLHVNIALEGKMTPKEALDKCAKQWDQITDAYGRENQIQFWRVQIQQWKALGMWPE